MLCRLTDGTTTVTLHDDSGSPTTPLVGAVYFPLDSGNGPLISETARVIFSGAVATLRSVTNDIERLLARASDPYADLDTYIEYRPTDSGDIYRSPLTSDSRIVWSEDRTLRQMGATNTTGEFALVLVRENYWEGPEATLGTGTIKNGTTSPYNILALTAPAGSLPTPLIVEIENASGTALSWRNFYLNVDAYVNMTTNQHLLSQSGSTAITGGTVYRFDVSSSIVDKWAGRDAQLVLALSSSFTGYIYAAAYIYHSSVYTEIYRGQERYVTAGRLIDLGSLPIPPGGNANASFAVAVGVYDAATISASFLQIAPAEHALHLQQLGYSIADGFAVFEDGRERQAWANSSALRLDIVRRSGGPLLAYPDRTNRLHLLFDESSNFIATRDTTLTVTARPRRRTI